MLSFLLMSHCTLSIPVAISKKYFIMLAIVLEEHSIHVQQCGWFKVTYSVEQAKSKIELQNEMSDFYIKVSWMLNIKRTMMLRIQISSQKLVHASELIEVWCSYSNKFPHIDLEGFICLVHVRWLKENWKRCVPRILFNLTFFEASMPV